AVVESLLGVQIGVDEEYAHQPKLSAFNLSELPAEAGGRNLSEPPAEAGERQWSVQICSNRPCAKGLPVSHSVVIDRSSVKQQHVRTRRGSDGQRRGLKRDAPRFRGGVLTDVPRFRG